MRYPERRWWGKTWVGWLNIVVLQWTCFRLAGNFEGGSGRFSTPRAFLGWKLLGPVLPCTGWRSDFIWLSKHARGRS